MNKTVLVITSSLRANSNSDALAAAQFRKLFPPLLILHDNHGCMLEIDPVRGRLYRLQNLFSLRCLYRLILIGPDRTMR